MVANTINKVRPYGGPRLTETSYGNQAYAEPSMSAQGIDQTFHDQSYQHMDQEYNPPPAQQYSQPQAPQTFNPNDEKWRVYFQDRSRSAQPLPFLSCPVGVSHGWKAGLMAAKKLDFKLLSHMEYSAGHIITDINAPWEHGCLMQMSDFLCAL